MKKQSLITKKKFAFANVALAIVMALSLLALSAAYPHSAFATTTDDSSVSAETQTVASEGSVHTETHTDVSHSDSDDSSVSTHTEKSVASDDKGDSEGVKDNDAHKGDHHDGDKKDGKDDEGDSKKGDDVDTIKHIMDGMNTSKPAVTLVASKIVCDAESKLPNWGLGGPDITANTAVDYVASHPGCMLTPNWKFQWGYSSVSDMGGAFVGEADGSKGAGSNTGTGVSDWKTFGVTDTSGIATTKIYDLAGTSRIWVREVLESGYVPFTFDGSHPSNENPVSAEMYCSTDVLNYDNYDYVNQPTLGSTYYCVAFNALKTPPHVNTAPVITVTGTNPITVIQDANYVDPGATVLDAEDGNITSKLITTGSVNTHVIGSYTTTYNATDTEGLAATTKTRTVNVVVAGTGAQNPGSITVCKVVMLDHVVTTSTSTLPYGIFSVTLLKAGTSAGSLEWNTASFSRNLDVIGTDGVLDANCKTLGNLSLGTYQYQKEEARGDNWWTPLYTETPATSVSLMHPYCGTQEDFACTDDSDGTIVLSSNQPNRTIVVVNDHYLRSTNSAPVITVTGTNPTTVIQGTTYVDLGATVFDAEDGIITSKLVITGAVNTALIGTYTITYNATDTQNLAAVTKTRTVNVVVKPTCTAIACPINQPPLITLVGANPMTVVQGTTFTDPFATALDPEDGTTTVTATGTVNTAVLGTYTITYTAVDSKGLAATPVTRTVNVVPAGTGSSNQKPEITVLGDVIMQLVVGTPYTDLGATAHDPEDGDITAKIIATGSVDVNTIGSYTITYNATDTKNLAAVEKTRTVNIVAAPTTGCTSGCGGGSGTFDYPGCIDPSALNYNRLANKSDGSCTYGGGGGGSVTLTISNEQLIIGTTSVTVTWNTNIAADSRVVYGLASVPTISAAPSYGYPLTTATDSAMVTSHTMLISGIPSGIATYFRPVSSNVSQTVTGIELTRSPAVIATTGGSCEYLKEYMRLGYNNNPSEVTKLQLFLKNYEGNSTLAVTGFFDITTDKAVRAFQDKYKADVLDTWNLPSNTGYVYYTTEKKINEIYCQREFPLSQLQKDEIVAFKALIEKVNAAAAASANTGSTGAVGGSTGSSETILPVVGVVGSGRGGEIAGASTVKTGPTITVTPADPSANGELGLSSAAGNKASPTTEKRGKIALADLLATSPTLASNITDTAADEASADMTDTTASNTDANTEVGGVAKKGLLAAVASSISTRLDRYSTTTIFGFTLMLLALVCIALYFTFRNFGTDETVAEMGEPTAVDAEVVEKE